MNTIRSGIIAAVGLVLVAWPTVGFAEFKPSAELRSACMSDVFKLCSGHLGSMDGIFACLQEKKSQASAKCQAQYDAESKTAAKK